MTLINKIVLNTFDFGSATYQATFYYTNGTSFTGQLGVNAVNDIFDGLYDQTTYSVPLVIQDSATQQFNGTIYPYVSTGGTISGSAITQPVQFDIILPNGQSKTGVVLSSQDYISLQNNILPFTVQNVSQGNFTVNTTYQSLASWIQSGQTTTVSSGTTVSGQQQNISVLVLSTYGTQKNFVVSLSDYSSLQSNFLQNLISSNVSTLSVNATYQDVVNFLSTTPTVSGTTSTTGTIQPSPSTTVSPSQTYNNVGLEIVATDGTDKTFVLSPYDANFILNAYTGYIKNTISSVNSPVDSTSQDVINFLLAHTAGQGIAPQGGTLTTNQLPPSFSPVPSPGATPQNPSGGTPTHGFETTFSDIKKDPMKAVIGVFAGVFTFAILAPRVNLKKKLKGKKGAKK